MVFHDANASIFAMLHNLTIKSEIQCEIITTVDPLILFNNYLPMLIAFISYLWARRKLVTHH